VKRLAAIRHAKDWREKLDLAQNKTPGTEFDCLFKNAALALELVKLKVGVEGEARLACIGRHFANLFERRDGGQKLHEMADALNAWHCHKPKLAIANRIRAELIALNGMFPAGKRHLLKVVDNKPIYGKPYGPLKVSDILDNLARHGLTITADKKPSIIREIWRQAKELAIRLDSSKGRPRKSKYRQK